jgi:hypothetical protein
LRPVGFTQGFQSSDSLADILQTACQLADFLSHLAQHLALVTQFGVGRQHGFGHFRQSVQ